MNEQQQQWQDKEQARKYGKQVSLTSRFVHASLARRVLAYLGPSVEAPVVVDLGCGPGLLGIEMGKLQPQARIIGVDPSGEMLQIARQNATAAGLSNYEARQGTAEEIPLEPSCSHLVISQSSFHEWEDPHKGLTEIHRVLAPGGSIIIKDYNLDWLSAWKRRLLGLLHPLHMFEFGFDDVASMARETGFEQIQGQAKGLQYFLVAVKGGGDQE